jgi:predicted P-loop ATPase
LSIYLQVESTLYTRAVGPRFLISAVARIYEPGCQADHMLVLEGAQGLLRSTAFRILAVQDEWFTDRLSPLATKDAAQETAGIWIVEVAELEAFTKSSSSSAKAFLTRRTDRYRPPYGKHTIRQPRQCIFVGTINPPRVVTSPTLPARDASGRWRAPA